ncbi:DUF3800 domain-containing protein [bacterium]|nr:hypothetical protein [bacterium]MBU3955549.1 DUF3800 domain-containing protein [bacterium]
MIIYLDESYDQPEKRYLILGLLFSPAKILHRKLTNIHNRSRCLDKHNNIIETKYNNCFTEHNYKVCEQFIDAFVKSDSWFCAIVVDTKITSFDLNYFGKHNETDAIKKARVYKKFTELIISRNTKKITNAVLLVDELTRANYDRFIELMRESFCVPGEKYSEGQDEPTFKHVGSVKSDSPENVRLCLCDLLMGCILNNNIPTRNRWKNKIREYLVGQLGIENLLRETWEKRKDIASISRKYRIWYWKPGNKKGSGD